MYPFKQKLTISTSTLIIVVIWVLAISIMCPSGVMLQVTKETQVSVLLGDGNVTRPFYWCHENWPNQEMRKIYTTVLFANIYLAPLTLIVIMYARIGITLFKTAVPSPANQESVNGSGSGSRSKPSGYETRHVASRKKKRVIKMLLVVALLFILSWLPLWTLMMLSDYASLNEVQHRVINIYIYPLAHWLAFCNSSVNPIIYGFFNENFRRGFQAAFKLQLCAIQKGRKRTYSHRVQGNAILPTDLNLTTQPAAKGKGQRPGGGMVHAFGKVDNEEPVSENSQGRKEELVKEPHMTMKDLDKVCMNMLLCVIMY